MEDFSNRIIPHYERHAQAWYADRQRSSWNYKPWHDRFVAALPKGGTVLGLGCGSGSPVALYMTACGLDVAGVYASPSLIALCRERMPGQRCIVGDVRAPPVAERFDGVLAWDNFFYLTPNDQRRMFDVCAKHCALRAVLMFNTGPAYGEVVGS